MTADTASVVRAFYADLWEKADFDLLPALLTEDVAFQGTFGQTMRGLDAFGAYVRSVREAFGTYRCDLRDLVVEGARAAARVGFSGTHDAGPFLGAEPSGRDLAWEGVGFFEVHEGRIRSLWVMGDMLGLMAQLKP